MTVCIGAISLDVVIVASDRMIAAGDVEFEQQQTKILPITSHVLALIAGDIPAQTLLVEQARSEARKRDLGDGRYPVSDVTQAYADAYGSYCKRKLRTGVHDPLSAVDAENIGSNGMTRNTPRTTPPTVRPRAGTWIETG